MEYTIRPLTMEDEPIVWEMLRHAAHEPSIAAVKQQPALTRYASHWGRKGDGGCVAIQGTNAIGAAWFRLWTGDDKGFGYISDEIPELAIALLPSYRNQGIGTALLKQTLELASEQFPAIGLNVRSDNAALRLYERVGFVKVPNSEQTNRVGGISFNMLRTFASHPRKKLRAI